MHDAHAVPQVNAEETHEVHITPVSMLVGIYLLLMVLLVATVAVSFFDLGEMNVVIAMAIAVAKATFVVLIFMHVKYSGKLIWIYAASAFVWLGIMLVLTFNDYLSRGHLPKNTMFSPDAPFVDSVPHKLAPEPKPFPWG